MATPIKYRISSVATKPTTDSVKGAPLTSLEIDGNFRSLKDSVEALSASGGASLVGFTPTGTVAATNVQSAINEVVSDLAAGTGASLVGYTPAGTGAVATTVQSKLRETVSVKDFGADPAGAADSSPAIIAALAAASHVVVPPGTYRCDSMIELNLSKTLELMGGATLIRKSANSASTDPVVWIKGSSASFIGAGQAVSAVTTENRSPKGVVRLGHKDMTESHDNVNYCTLKDMSIGGSTAYGQTTGDPDVALYMPNPQFGDKTSYFHNIFGLRVQNANYGIWLHGWANANTISNIQGYRIGNTTLGTNKNAFIYLNGALDNSASCAFFHGSPNSIGLLIDDLNNTGNGGVVHNVYANSFSGMVFEQGGASALGVKSVVATGNGFYEVRHNTAGGNSLPAGFTSQNVFIGLSSIEANITSAAVTGTTVAATGETRALGSIRQGDSGEYYVARKVKRNASTNASTVSFTLSNTAQASVWRSGFMKITVAGGDNGMGTAPHAAWYVYSMKSLSTAYPSIDALRDSGGDTASFTVTDSGNGVITVSSTEDAIVCELEYGFTTTNVNVT